MSVSREANAGALKAKPAPIRNTKSSMRLPLRPGTSPETTSRGQKIAKKYVLATDATDISHTSHMSARAHAQSPWVSEESVANVADSPKAEGIEARRIAAELVKLHRTQTHVYYRHG